MKLILQSSLYIICLGFFIHYPAIAQHQENNAVPLVTTPPTYPNNAKKEGISADVVLQFDITTKGKPSNIKVVDVRLSSIQNDSSNINDFAIEYFIKKFSGASKKAVKKWKFKAKENNGKAVLQKDMTYTLKYKLTNTPYKLMNTDVSNQAISLKSHDNNTLVSFDASDYPVLAYFKGIKSDIHFKFDESLDNKMEIQNIDVMQLDDKPIHNEIDRNFLINMFQEKANSMIQQHYVKSYTLKNTTKLENNTLYTLSFNLISNPNPLNNGIKLARPILPISNLPPQKALDNNIIGNVIYQFDIKKDGFAKKIKIIQANALNKDNSPLNLEKEYEFIQEFINHSLDYIKARPFRNEKKIKQKNMIYEIVYKLDEENNDKHKNITHLQSSENKAIPLKIKSLHFPEVAKKKVSKQMFIYNLISQLKENPPI